MQKNPPRTPAVLRKGVRGRGFLQRSSLPRSIFILIIPASVQSTAHGAKRRRTKRMLDTRTILRLQYFLHIFSNLLHLRHPSCRQVAAALSAAVTTTKQQVTDRTQQGEPSMPEKSPSNPSCSSGGDPGGASCKEDASPGVSLFLLSPRLCNRPRMAQSVERTKRMLDTRTTLRLQYFLHNFSNLLHPRHPSCRQVAAALSAAVTTTKQQVTDRTQQGKPSMQKNPPRTPAVLRKGVRGRGFLQRSRLPRSIFILIIRS